MFPPSIRNLIEAFNKLPGIGPKTSERFAFFLLNRPQRELEQMADSVRELKKDIVTCQLCHQYAGRQVCDICSDGKRDHSIICIVALSQDIPPIEKTRKYQGLYHVLNGVINQIENIGPEDLNISTLLRRIQQQPVKEIIIATNPDIEGETTALYLAKVLRPFAVNITRLARGLPMGADIEYADEITLGNAILGRRSVE